MQILWEGLREGFILLVEGNPELWGTVGLSLGVSSVAVGIATVLGIPLGTLLALGPGGWGRKLMMLLISVFMGLPPVLAGLLVYLVLSAQGPLGAWKLLFTPGAMVLAQALLALPVITGLTCSAVKQVPTGIRDAAQTLGAPSHVEMLTVLREVRPALAVAAAAGLGRVLAEVGAVMMVGGNIAGRTRVMTTAIVLETQRGNFDRALGLGLILLVLSFVLNGLISVTSGDWEA